MNTRVALWAPSCAPETGASIMVTALGSEVCRALACDPWLGGGGVDEDGAQLEAVGEPVITEDAVADSSPVRQHREDDLGRFRHGTRRLGGECALVAACDPAGHVGREVVKGERMPTLGQMPHHGAAHHAEADETDAHGRARRVDVSPPARLRLP
jgi:hypothetical protein